MLHTRSLETEIKGMFAATTIRAFQSVAPITGSSQDQLVYPSLLLFLASYRFGFYRQPLAATLKPLASMSCTTCQRQGLTCLPSLRFAPKILTWPHHWRILRLHSLKRLYAALYSETGAICNAIRYAPLKTTPGCRFRTK